MKIVVDDNIPYIRGRIDSGADVVYVDQNGFTPELVRDADALLIRTRTRCDRNLLEGSSVRLVATATIGTDQIDMEWCAKAGIHVANSSGCNAPAVAQYVWSALLRTGFDPSLHTLGIVGCGNVGSIVREWGSRFGARILVSDPPRQERERLAGLDSEIEYVPLEELLAESDAVTLHTPLTRGSSHPSYHLIGEDELAMMRPGALLINAARGAVVDFEALRRVVLPGRLRAVVDTWEGEPQVDTELLRAVEYGTFHIAGYSRQGKERATRMVLEALRDTLGVDVITDGLEGPYRGSDALTTVRVLDSYDPAADTEALRHAPEEFDTLRRNYNYREEA